MPLPDSCAFPLCEHGESSHLIPDLELHPHERPPLVVDWDELDSERIGLFPPKPSRCHLKPPGDFHDRMPTS